MGGATEAFRLARLSSVPQWLASHTDATYFDSSGALSSVSLGLTWAVVPRTWRQRPEQAECPYVAIVTVIEVALHQLERAHGEPSMYLDVLEGDPLAAIWTAWRSRQGARRHGVVSVTAWGEAAQRLAAATAEAPSRATPVVVRSELSLHVAPPSPGMGHGLRHAVAVSRRACFGGAPPPPGDWRQMQLQAAHMFAPRAGGPWRLSPWQRTTLWTAAAAGGGAASRRQLVLWPPIVHWYEPAEERARGRLLALRAPNGTDLVPACVHQGLRVSCLVRRAAPTPPPLVRSGIRVFELEEEAPWRASLVARFDLLQHPQAPSDAAAAAAAHAAAPEPTRRAQDCQSLVRALRLMELRQTVAARTLQRAWRRAVSDPAHAVCRARLVREWRALAEGAVDG